MRKVILYRGDDFAEAELPAAEAAGFFCTRSRMDVREGDLVVPRYSSLPFYREQEHDINVVGAKMINTYAQHRYIADLKNWYEDLRDLTPSTWRNVTEIPDGEDGPFVLKGETNSKKFLFDTHMFAKDRSDIGRVLNNLLDDSLISTQDIYIRKFERLKTFHLGIRGLPVTSEFRFFVAYDQVISGGFYWSSHIEELRENGWTESNFNPDQVPPDFLGQVISKINCGSAFYVIDVAQKEDGSWIVIELNSGDMSGLSENNPEVLYENLAATIDREFQ